MEFFSNLLSALPGAAAQGLIWGLMAIGVFITFRVLDLADLTVDGTMATGWITIDGKSYFLKEDGSLDATAKK